MDEQTRKDIARHRAAYRALNERVTELRRKMPDDEPCTIILRLHENGEFLWADEAHVEGALLTEDLLKDDAEWLADELAKGRPQRA